ncbi:MAG: hypothetical protein O9324_14945 [Microcystis sp. LE19-84.1B]|nr:hypothetical protein [Microcystis sp. LE19-84.1B]MCZ8225204.1 hypothetical protein [Microcystis sp. LE19-84.1B]NCS29854.1 hypothetical protein [Microcystis aeruginosa F13-15]
MRYAIANAPYDSAIHVSTFYYYRQKLLRSQQQRLVVFLCSITLIIVG